MITKIPSKTKSKKVVSSKLDVPIARVGRKSNFYSTLTNGPRWLSEVEKIQSPPKNGKGIIRNNLLSFFQTFPGTLAGEPKDMEQWRRWRRAYKNIPIVRSAIDLTTDTAIQNIHVPEIEGDDKGPKHDHVIMIKKLIRQFNLLDFFRKVTKELLIFGNCFVEVVMESNVGIADLKILDPVTMFINRNEFGNFNPGQTDAYLQFLELRPLEPITFSADEIIHFIYSPVGEGPYGIGLIEPLWAMLALQEEVEHDMAMILRRYTAPFIQVKVGDAVHNPFPQQGDIDSYSADLENIFADTEYVTPWNVDMEVKGSQKATLDIDPYIKYIEHQLIAGLQVPMVLLGRGEGAQRATAEVQMASHDRKIKVLQRVVKRKAELEIFIPHIKEMFEFDEEIDDVPELRFGEPEERVTAEQIDTILKVAQAGLVSPQKANDLLPDEFREQLPPELKTQKQDSPDVLQKDMTKPTNPKMNRVKKGKEKRNPKKPERKADG